LNTYPAGKDAAIYGYTTAYTANTPVSVVLSPVRSNAQYFFKAVCVTHPEQLLKILLMFHLSTPQIIKENQVLPN